METVQQIYALSSRIRLMPVNNRSDPPDAQIDHFHKRGDGHREIHVALRYVQAQTLADQDFANVGLEQIVQLGGAGAFFQGHSQTTALAMNKLENRL
jgi:hypothetical protein